MKFTNSNYPYRKLQTTKTIIILCVFTIINISCNNTTETYNVSAIFERVANHDFHPLNEKNTLTVDKNLGVVGLADLDNQDWKIRTLAVRDLLIEGIESSDRISNGLNHESIYVRQISAMSLGILRANSSVTALEYVLMEDENAMVRAQAAIALGQIESESSLDLLKERLINDPENDVRHQCELAIDQIIKKAGTTKKQLAAYLALDESTFETVNVGDMAPDFTLEDTEGNPWTLNQFKNEKWTVLIWIFADWCPVCHGEFRDLMKLQDEFSEENIQLFTIEAHDTYRGRVMVGKELDPNYWFAKESFQEAYTKQIRWPHLLDRAGALGAMYGADPLTFSVHAEYINRPTTVIIDPEGKVRFIYVGTYWGDRPTIEQTLDFIKTESFEFEHPRRLKLTD